MYVLAMVSKTEGAWNGIGTVVGTLARFLGGIYIPIGALSGAVGAIMKCTPVIYSTAMFRIVMTQEITETTFSGLPEEIAEGYRTVMGIHLDSFGRKFGITEDCLLLLLCGMIFLGIGVCMLKG